MQYVIMLSHPPHLSPLSNKVTREMADKSYAQMPTLTEKHKVKVVAGYHLDPEHRAMVVVEAPSIEAVRDLLYEAGFMHWNDATIYPTTPLHEIHEWVKTQPTIF